MKLHLILLLLYIIQQPTVSLADKAAKLNKNGIKLYQEKKLEESVHQFTEALVERPDSPKLRFNRGTALSAIGKKDESVSELESAAQTFENSTLSAAAYFNAGNTHLASGDLTGAIEAYKKAVKLDQSSRDIRHNLELALKKLQEQQKQEQKKDKDDQKQDKKNEEQGKHESDQDENKKQQDKQEQQSQQPQQQENGQKPMTQEEAQRILDAMNDEEKKAFELRKMMIQNAMRPGDDW